MTGRDAGQAGKYADNKRKRNKMNWFMQRIDGTGSLLSRWF
jgi:hypothetical protein